jgi:hypothetical protein
LRAPRTLAKQLGLPRIELKAAVPREQDRIEAAREILLRLSGPRPWNTLNRRAKLPKGWF